MSSSSAIEQLAALDFPKMSESDRLSAILEIKAQLEAIKADDHNTQTGSVQTLALLRMWQTLEELRIKDVRKDVPPPNKPLTVSRMFPPAIVETENLEAGEEHEEGTAHVEDHAISASDVVAPDDEKYVSVRLIQSGTLRGVRLPEGIVIDVAGADADHLIETGIARLLTDDEKTAPKP